MVQRVMLLGAGGQLGTDWLGFLRREKTGIKAFASTNLDITQSQKLSQAVHGYKPEIIINCAAFTGVDAAEDDPETARRVNHEAVKNLARISSEVGALLVHYSTDYVFSGSEADMIRFPSGFDESHVPRPANVYAHSKYDGERAISGSGCEHLIVRLSWLCGASGKNFVKTMLRFGEEKEEIRVVNDQFGSPTFTKNAILNSWALLASGERGLWHITSRGIITWYDFAVEIMHQAGLNARIVPVPTSGYPTRAFRPAYTKLSTRSLENVNGARLISWREGLKELLEELMAKKAKT